MTVGGLGNMATKIACTSLISRWNSIHLFTFVKKYGGATAVPNVDLSKHLLYDYFMHSIIPFLREISVFLWAVGSLMFALQASLVEFSWVVVTSA